MDFAASAVSLLACVAVFAGAATFVNGAAGGPARELRGRIEAIVEHATGEDSDETSADILWEDGFRSRLHFKDPDAGIREGNPVWSRSGEGALGVVWDRDDDAVGDSDIVLPPGEFPRPGKLGP